MQVFPFFDAKRQACKPVWHQWLLTKNLFETFSSCTEELEKAQLYLPTVPTPEAIKQVQYCGIKSGKYATTNETWPDDDASRKCPARTGNQGPDEKHSACVFNSQVSFLLRICSKKGGSTCAFLQVTLKGLSGCFYVRRVLLLFWQLCGPDVPVHIQPFGQQWNTSSILIPDSYSPVLQVLGFQVNESPIISSGISQPCSRSTWCEHDKELRLDQLFIYALGLSHKWFNVYNRDCYLFL